MMYFYGAISMFAHGALQQFAGDFGQTISYYQEPPKTNRNHFIYQEPLKKYKPFHNARNLVETIWNRFDYQGNH